MARCYYQVPRGTENLVIKQLVKEGHLKTDSEASAINGGYVEVPGPLPPTVQYVIHRFSRLRTVALTLNDVASADLLKEKVLDLLNTMPMLFQGRTFRVSGIRHARYRPISSQDLAGFVGGRIQERYGLEVELKNFDHEIVVEWHDDLMMIGERVNRSPLDAANLKPFHPRGAIRHAVAALMVAWTDLYHGDSVLDLFSGSGTFGIQARRRGHVGRLVALDYNQRMIDGMLENYQKMHLAPPDRVFHCDVMEGVEWGERVDVVFANPPFGVHMGRSLNFDRFYQTLFETLKNAVTPRARMAMVVYKSDLFERAMYHDGGFELVDKVGIFMGGVKVQLYLIQPKIAA